MHDVEHQTSDRSLLSGLIGDGRPALATVGMALAFAGGLAVYLGVTRQLLPHDLAFLGMTRDEIEAIANGRLLDFMVHDRVAWGGSLLAVGVMYLWLVAFPLSSGRRWAWNTFAITGIIGFGTAASYLPTGYFDSWHGIGMLLLAPVFAVGLYKSRELIAHDQVALVGRLAALTWGRRMVVATGLGLAVSAVIILIIGMTTTFVPSDLAFIGVDADGLDAINERLVPLVAHDRVGFSGGVLVGGLLIGAAGLFGEGRAVRSAVAIAGISGFGLAVWVHFAVGYTDPFHLAPSIVGPVALYAGLAMWGRESRRQAEAVSDEL